MESKSALEMPKNNDNKDEDFALHKLDDDSLLEIFRYLSLEDARNLAKTSKRLKNLWLWFRYRKITFEFNSDMLSKTTERGRAVVDVILLEYGEYIRSWSFSIVNRYRNDAVEVLQRVSQYCKNLKCIEFKGIADMGFISNCSEAIECFANVEILSFEYCRQINPADFLQHFRNLKQLHFYESGITSNNLQILLNNSPGIESCYCNGSDFGGEKTFNNDFGQVSKLGLSLNPPVKTHNYIQMDKMLLLASSPYLTKLKLDLPYIWNLNIILTELAKKGNLNELEIMRVELDGRGVISSWNTIAESFPNLKLLTFCPEIGDISMYTFSLPDWRDKKWPTNVTHLKTNISINTVEFESMLRELKWLSHLQLDNMQDFRKSVIISKLKSSLRPRWERPHLTLEMLCRKGYRIELIVVNYRTGTVIDREYPRKETDDFIKIDFSILYKYPQNQFSKAFGY